jgi:hypothetical protein
MNNEQKRVLTYGVKLGTLKRKRWNWRRFLWQFLLVAALTLGVFGGMVYLLTRYDKIHAPLQQTIYDSQVRATPHDRE